MMKTMTVVGYEEKDDMLILKLISDDAVEMTGIMIIWKNISALKQKLIQAKTNKNQLNFYLAATLGIGKWPLNRGLS